MPAPMPLCSKSSPPLRRLVQIPSSSSWALPTISSSTTGRRGTSRSWTWTLPTSAPGPLLLADHPVSQTLQIPPLFLLSNSKCPNTYVSFHRLALIGCFLPALSIYVRAPETEVHYWAVFLRDLTVPELIKRVVQKYGFSDDERARVKTVVRVTDRQQGVRLLEDEDVKTMEPEIAIDVKVSSLDPQSEDWQLELRY